MRAKRFTGLKDYKVFLSCSWAPKDSDLIKLLGMLCRAVGLEPMQIERPGVEAVSQKVRNGIREADLVVAVLSRHEALAGDQDRWQPPPWVTQELGMAFQANKSVVLLVEQGVVTEGLVDKAFDYLVFDRAAIKGGFDSAGRDCLEGMIRFLTVAKETFPKDRQQNVHAIYSLDEIDLLFDIDATGLLTATEHMVIRSRVPELVRLSQRRIITSSSRLCYGDSSLELLSSAGDERTTLKVNRLEAKELQYDLVFDPPLGPDDSVEVAAMHRSRGSLPLVEEDARWLISQRDYIHSEPVARQGKAIKMPTDRLSMELHFPPGYKPEKPRIEVVLKDRQGKSREAMDESDRIKRDGIFRVLHNRLILEVPNPLQNHAYYLSWRPPRAGSTEALRALRLFETEAGGSDA